MPPNEFYNSYNFLPPMPIAKEGSEFSHGPARSLAFSPAESVSGSIDICITTVTPLLAIDPNRITIANGHPSVVTRTVGGTVFLDPAGLKGVLRSLFEAVTGSRMGALNGHDRPAGFREPPNPQIKREPVRIVERDGRWVAQRLTGAPPERRLDAGASQLMAAWVGLRTGQRFAHGAEVHAWVVRFSKRLGNRAYECWRVVQIARSEAELSKEHPVVPQQLQQGAGGNPEFRQIHGWLHKTGDTSFPRKHDERIFFVDSAEPEELPVSQEVAKAYQLLIEDYGLARLQQQGPNVGEYAREAATRDDGMGGLRPPTSKMKWQQLRDGMTLYAEIHDEVIGRLVPVENARVLSPAPMSEFIPGHLRPPTAAENLSMADRVFGTVAGTAAAGRVRIEPLQTNATPKSLPGGHTLGVLAEPKPVQGRFYLGVAAERGVQPQRAGRAKRRATYGKPGEQTIRGFKVYPHHRDFRPEATTAEPGNMNRTVLDWVPAGSEFGCRVWLDGLTEVEAGALLWLLGLPDGLHLRMGGAKPFGFGSARCVVERSELRTGAQLKARLGVWPPVPEDAPAQFDALVNVFQEACAAAFGEDGGKFDELPTIKALATALGGYGNDVPVQAPPDGFGWFSANERGRKLSLPALEAGDDGHLPQDPTAQPPHH